jgi:predicted nucleic acid-binding protein
MRIADTSAWIEYLIGSETGKSLAPSMPQGQDCIVPTIVQLELTKWLSREASEAASEKVIADTMECVVADLDTKTALLAAEMARNYRLATADAIIYATSRIRDAELLTCDAHFKGLPGVIYFPKAPA